MAPRYTPLRLPPPKPRNVIKPSSVLQKILPPELLAQIFVVLLDNLANQTIGNARHALRSTCKYWKTVMESTPEIWAFLDIRVDRTTPTSSLETIQLWLERSKQFPLRIRMTVERPGPPMGSMPGLLADHLLKELFRHVDRWYTVSFSFALNSEATFPSFEGGITAPLLEIAEIGREGKVDTTYMNCKIDWIGKLLQHSPRLHTFIDSIQPTPAYIMPYAGYIPFRQLSIVKLKEILPFDKAHRLIRDMPRLEICHITIDYGSGSPFEEPITCTARELKVTVRLSAKKFFDPILAPNLETFEVFITPDQPILVQGDGQYMLWEFLRHAPNLSSFNVQNLFMTDDDLVGCLQALSPKLRTLKILVNRDLSTTNLYKVENFTNKVITALLGYEGSEDPKDPICPELETLVLQRCVAADDGRIADLVQTRYIDYQRAQKFHDPTIPASRLSHFDVVFRFHSHQYDQDVLKTLRYQGLAGETKLGMP